jgi:hypothetical protein
VPTLALESRIRVAVVAERGVRSDVLSRSLDAEPDIAVVLGVDQRGLEDDAVAQSGAHVVVWALDSGQSGVEEFLLAHPRLPIVAVEDAGRNAGIYVLQPRREPLGELTPDRLANAVRAAARGRR